MDRTKLNIIISVTCLLLLVFTGIIEYSKLQAINDVKLLMNESNFNCCAVYRNPIMTSVCGNYKSNTTVPSPLTTYLPLEIPVKPLNLTT